MDSARAVLMERGLSPPRKQLRRRAKTDPKKMGLFGRRFFGCKTAAPPPFAALFHDGNRIALFPERMPIFQ
jgi:hypothetical protein